MSSHEHSEQGKFYCPPYRAWKELTYAFINYSRAKTKNDFSMMIEYAEKILYLENQLGIRKSKFPELGLKNSL